MANILVVEDESDLQTVLEYNLKQVGHVVSVTGLGREGLRLCRETLPDIVILDLMLPDLSGLEVCKALRRDPKTRSVPILMLTAKTEEVDRVVGFELGADDYAAKPFSLRELLLRVAAILRRIQDDAPTSSVIQFGFLRIDRDAHRVWVDGNEVELTPLELKLLVILHERKNRVQSRESLLDEVWGITAEVTTRTVDTHVKRLREKLGPAADYIETVRGTGYRFSESPDGSHR